MFAEPVPCLDSEQDPQSSVLDGARTIFAAATSVVRLGLPVKRLSHSFVAVAVARRGARCPAHRIIGESSVRFPLGRLFEYTKRFMAYFEYSFFDTWFSRPLLITAIGLGLFSTVLITTSYNLSLIGLS